MSRRDVTRVSKVEAAGWILYSHSAAPLKNTCEAEPRTIPIAFADRTVVFDTNSLMLHDGEIEPSREAPAIPRCRPRAPRNPYIVLNLTYQCQLACRYCFVRADEDRPQANMSIATAIRAIRCLVPAGALPHVGFFGGEPTLNFDTLQAVVIIVEKLAKLYNAKPPSFSLTTNGVLPGQIASMSEFLFARNFHYIVSLDGDRITHNAMRPMKSGEDSHAGACAFLDRAKASGVTGNITLRSTFTAQNMNIVERLEYLNDLAASGHARYVSVEPVTLCADTCPVDIRHLAFEARDLECLKQGYEKAADWTIERVRAGKPAFCHQIMNTAQRLYYRIPHMSECGAGRGYITVSPNGDYHACHRAVGEPIGNLRSGVNPEAINAWRDNTLNARPACRDCAIRYVCGGGCRAESICAGHDVAQPFASSCAIRQSVFRAAVKILSSLEPIQIQKYLAPVTGRRRS